MAESFGSGQRGVNFAKGRAKHMAVLSRRVLRSAQVFSWRRWKGFVDATYDVVWMLVTGHKRL
jgi:hypothetical protein